MQKYFFKIVVLSVGVTLLEKICGIIYILYYIFSSLLTHS